MSVCDWYCKECGKFKERCVCEKTERVSDSLNGLVGLAVKSAMVDFLWKVAFSKIGTHAMREKATTMHNAMQWEKVNAFAFFVNKSGWGGMNCVIDGKPHIISVRPSNDAISFQKGAGE